MKNRATNILLALFFAGLIGYWWADSSGLRDRSQRQQIEGRVLPSLINTRPDDVRKLVILDESAKSKIVLERRGLTSWQITAPIDAAADPAMVESLAFTLKELSRIPEAGTIDDPAKLAEFGFSPARKSIQVWGEDPSVPLAELDLGISQLNRRYVRARGSSGIEVVEATALVAIDVAPASWRDRQLVRASSFDVLGVEVTGSGRNLDVRRNGTSWRIVKPFIAPADDQQLEGLIADLTSAKVTSDAGFAADGVKDFKPFGLDPARLTIRIGSRQRDGKGRIQEIQIGGPVHVVENGKSQEVKGKVYAKRSDQDDVMVVDAAVFEKIGREPLAYRSKKVLDHDPGRILAIEIESGKRTMTFGRDTTGWKMVGPNATKIDSKPVTELAKSLNDLQASVFLQPADVPNAGLDDPVTTVRIWTSPSGPLPREAERPKFDPASVLKIGRRDAGKRVAYVRAQGDDTTILAVPDKFLDQIPRSPLAFQDRVVLRLDPSQIETISIERFSQSFKLKAPSSPTDYNQWKITQPFQAGTDPEAVGRLLALLTGVPAESFVTDDVQDLSRFGLKSPSVRFSWTSNPAPQDAPKPKAGVPAMTRGPETGTFLLGDEVPGRQGARFGMLEGKPLIFTISGTLVKVFEAELRDRAVVSFDPKNVSQVRLQWPKLTVSLIPPPSDQPNAPWTFAGPLVVQPGFDVAKVGELVARLSNLMAERFVIQQGSIPETTGLPRNSLKIEVLMADGVKSRVLRLGRMNGQGSIYATNESGQSGPVFLLPESEWSKWLRPIQLGDELPNDVFAP